VGRQTARAPGFQAFSFELNLYRRYAEDVIKKMLVSNPKNRIKASEVLNHPWVREDGDAPAVGRFPMLTSPNP
jgi:serine/threonine protein kinase